MDCESREGENEKKKSYKKKLSKINDGKSENIFFLKTLRHSFQAQKAVQSYSRRRTEKAYVYIQQTGFYIRCLIVAYSGS